MASRTSDRPSKDALFRFTHESSMHERRTDVFVVAPAHNGEAKLRSCIVNCRATMTRQPLVSSCLSSTTAAGTARVMSAGSRRGAFECPRADREREIRALGRGLGRLGARRRPQRRDGRRAAGPPKQLGDARSDGAERDRGCLCHPPLASRERRQAERVHRLLSTFGARSKSSRVGRRRISLRDERRIRR